ncbi:MAG TPA: Uma2 family endonuclease [Blastocatellia bacterium]|nr:Uma2 family endonuclease [Blastocatellia bacterium]
MSLPRSQPASTVGEYLELERTSEERHEFLDGQIYAMAGESIAHGDICTNLVAELRPQLRGTACRVLSKDIKIRSGPAPGSRHSSRGLFSYPDVVIVCEEPQFHDEYQDVVLNPTVIIEVLSPSTEAFDRGEKWFRYQTWLPSLTDYILVSQSKPLLEHYRRQRNGDWLYTPVKGLDGTIEVIDCSLRLVEVYDRVTFPDDPTE